MSWTNPYSYLDRPPVHGHTEPIFPGWRGSGENKTIVNDLQIGIREFLILVVYVYDILDRRARSKLKSVSIHPSGNTTESLIGTLYIFLFRWYGTIPFLCRCWTTLMMGAWIREAPDWLFVWHTRGLHWRTVAMRVYIINEASDTIWLIK